MKEIQFITFENSLEILYFKSPPNSFLFKLEKKKTNLILFRYKIPKKDEIKLPILKPFIGKKKRERLKLQHPKNRRQATARDHKSAHRIPWPFTFGYIYELAWLFTGTLCPK